MIISLLVAVDEQMGIGKNNRLPWNLPSDLKRFKKLTMGHHLVMGRKTYDTIGKPLPGRVMIVITRQKNYQPEGCIVVNSLEAAIQYAAEQGEVELFIIGGGQIFTLAMQLADRIYVTRVHAVGDADIFFPAMPGYDWKLISSDVVDRDDRDEYESEYQIYQRVSRIA